jgi:selenocysteine-specific elongation factor
VVGSNVMTSPLTVAVIGHVNHGKTALIRALTGIETDRLSEEIERGLSITLGFAWRDYGSGGVDLIDSPGHEDYIRAMVAGATGARAVLLVVSAVEGLGRQTLEHLQIAGLLGIDAGVVAITKADRLAPGGEAAIRAEVENALRETFLAGEPIVLCSSVSRAGLETLHSHLEALARRCAPSTPLDGAFLPIDRAFTITGTGAVVTGTLRGGSLATDDQAVLEPSGRKVSLKQIQVHGRDVDSAEPGGRVAVSLRGLSAHEVRAGEVLCAQGSFQSTPQVDVMVTVTPDSARPLKHMDEIRVMWGARNDIATLRLFGAKAIAPGAQGLAQLRFSAPVIAFAGQRAVLRRPSPAETVGGALVLDPQAAPIRGKVEGRLAILEAALAGDLAGIAAGLARRDGDTVSVVELARLSRLAPAETRRRLDRDFEAVDGARLAPRSAVDAARRAYLDVLAKAHRETPAKATVSVGAIRSGLAGTVSRDLAAHAERVLAATLEIRLDGGRVALPSHNPFAALSPEALQRLGQIEAALKAGGLTPPDARSLAGEDAEGQTLLDLLVDSGRAVSLRNVALKQTLVFHPDSLDLGFQALRAAFPPPAEFTTGEARAALGVTRKFIVPILEYFDMRGLTRREGDVRQVIVSPPLIPP